MKLFKSTVSLLLALAFSLNVIAQSTEFKTTRHLEFKESSKVQKISINLTEKTSSLSLEILCSVKGGSVTVEIYNPLGEKQGEFAVESIESENDGTLFSELSDGVSGEIRKSINEPQLGKWIIKFTPYNASGRVQMYSYQFQ